MMCPICGGDGKEDGYYPYMSYHDPTCGFCKGRGWISITAYMQYVRDHRRNHRRKYIRGVDSNE